MRVYDTPSLKLVAKLKTIDPRKLIVVMLVFLLVGASMLHASMSIKHLEAIFPDGTVFRLTDVSSDSDRARGLAGVKSLGATEGMVFRNFSTSQVGIWMKDMSIDIDIMWLDDDKKIIHIEQQISPNTYPKSYRNPPGTAARYVIEVPAGTVAKHHLKPGNVIKFT